MSYRDPERERRSHRIYMWGQAPFLHSLLAVSRRRQAPGRPFRGCYGKTSCTGGRAGHFSTRAYFLRTGLECNLCWGPRLGRLQRARTSALERGPTSTIELGDRREEIYGWLQSSHLPLAASCCGRLCSAAPVSPFWGLVNYRACKPQRLSLWTWCAPGGSECVVQRDGLMLGVSAERGGRVSRSDSFSVGI